MGERINSQKNSSTMTSKAQQVSTPLFQTRAFSNSASLTETEVVQSKQSSFNFNFLNIPTHAPTQPGQIQQKEEEKEDREVENDVGLQMQSGDGTIPHSKSSDLEGDIQTKSISGDREVEQEQENVPLQTKLTVGQPGDKYEQEADNMAARVMAMPDSAIGSQKESQTQEIQASPLVNNITRLVQRQIQNKEKIQTKPGLQRTANGSLQASSSLESSLASSKGGGSALPGSVRSFMEPRFGADFSAVRVHTDSNAVQMNKELGAAAFAHGNDIYYGAGKSPGNNELTAHELTHTIQQTGGLRLNKQISPKADKEESIAAKQLSISTSPVTDNKELSLKPATSELEQTSKPLQAKQLTNYSSGENKSSIQRQPLHVSQVSPRIQGNSAGGIEDKIAPLARRIPGYELLALILGKDPISGTSVERNPTNLIRTLLSLVPNGSNIFQNLEQSGALQRAFNWFNQEIKKLNLSWDAIKGLFTKALQSLGLADIFNPFGAVKKVENIFIQPIVRIKNFAVAAGTKVMEFAFEGFLNKAGGAGAKVMSIIRNAGGAIANIVKDPVGFGGNLVAGVKGGFQKFASNMPTHLKNGMTGWLFGAMASAGLALPAQFDLKGVVSLVLQVLGLTYDKLRGKLVKLLGEPRVKQLEQAFDFLKKIVTGGLAAAWQKISEFAGNLQEMVIGGIRSWVQNTIISAAITKLISMFNPAGAIVQAVMAIYNTIMFFVERGEQIAALSGAVFASIGNIAAGNVTGAANYVEQAMARSLPVMISFLARLIGLGGISEQIKNLIKKIQTPIDNTMNKLAGFVVDKSKSLFSSSKENSRNNINAGTVGDKKKILEDAVNEVQILIKSPKSTLESVEEKLPAIQKKYQLTSLNLIKEKKGVYHVHATINPTLDGPPGVLFTAEELHELEAVAKDFSIQINRKDKEKPGTKAKFLAAPEDFIRAGNVNKSGDIVEAAGSPGIEQIAAEAGLTVVRNAYIQFIDAAGKSIGGRGPELDFLILGSSGVQEIVSAKLKPGEYKPKQDKKLLRHFVDMPLVPPDIITYAQSNFGKNKAYLNIDGAKVNSSLGEEALASFRAKYLSKVVVDKITVTSLTPGPELTQGLQLRVTDTELLAKVVELVKNYL